MILNIILGVIGAFFGAAILDEEGILFGFVMGCLLGMVVNLRRRVTELEKRFESLELRQMATRVRPPSPAKPPEPEAEKPAPEPDKPEPPRPDELPEKADVIPIRSRPESEKPPVSDEPPRPDALPEPPAEAESLTRLTEAVRAFFTGGNVVVRIGVIILFFGVAFLLKFAAERGMFPIELRLACVGLGGIALLMTGWRLRERRPGYALILQGGAIGILYLNLFAAARLYHLIPLPLTFLLMIALVVLSGLLAVLQDSLGLAAFGAVGGFLAPVLTSSGRGNHVMLFSYYALLNAGILQVAWFKAWRVLNLIGFVFTFGIGTIWGIRAYTPSHFATTEPFLILFFLFYAAISVLFAHRQPPRLRGYVDGTLVFGLPIVAFALQSQLTEGYEYGLAFSALALSGFYITLASLLWRRQAEGMRMLTEAFLALGVVFGSLAIPLALDGRWTAAAWALEGAALIWVGIRQQRLLSRNFGVLLQLGGGMAFLADIHTPTGDIPVFNGLFLGSLAVSLAGLFSSWYLERNRQVLRRWEGWHHGILLVWGLLWWFGTGLNEIHDFLPRADRGPASLLFVVLSCGGMVRISVRLSWNAISYPLAGLLPLLWILACGLFAERPFSHLFTRWGLIPWIAGFVVHFYLLWQFEKRWHKGVIRLWHLGGLLLAVFILTWESVWVIGEGVGRRSVWAFMIWGIIPGLAILSLQKQGHRLSWPVLRFAPAYLKDGPAILATFIGFWELAAAFRPGDPAPLPYLPLLNPLDLAQIFGFIVMLGWVRADRQADSPRFSDASHLLLYSAVSAIIFIWLNALVARTVHFWGHVPFTRFSLYHSVLFQAAISILWTLTALGIMAVAARKGHRPIWFTGAVLLALVVLKLFTIDLDGSGTVARIVSFLAVGGLMLVIGYVAPLPSRQEEKTDQ